MANYTDTIFKVFVPRELEALVPHIVTAIAAEGMDTSVPVEEEERQNRMGQWVDFTRLLPIPADMLAAETEQKSFAYSLFNDKWPRAIDLPEGVEIPDDPEEREKLAEQYAPGTAATLAAMRKNTETYGVPIAYEYQVGRWGTKWQPDEIQPPQIENAQDFDRYHEMGDSVMITWRIVTAWTHPSGYLERLSNLCEQHGFGFMAWFSDEDGGTQWNPGFEEYVTIWTPLDDLEVVPGDVSESDIVVMLSEGIDFGPDEDTRNAVIKRDPIHLLFG